MLFRIAVCVGVEEGRDIRVVPCRSGRQTFPHVSFPPVLQNRWHPESSAAHLWESSKRPCARGHGWVTASKTGPNRPMSDSSAVSVVRPAGTPVTQYRTEKTRYS